MKRLLSAIGLLLCALPARAACVGTDIYSAAVCADTPAEYLRLDETNFVLNGVTAADFSGNGKNGRYSAVSTNDLVGSQSGIPGCCGTAVSFNPVATWTGNNAVIVMCENGGSLQSCDATVSTWLSPIGAGTWSAEFWMKFPTASNSPCNTAFGNIMAKMNNGFSGANTNEWEIYTSCSGAPTIAIGFVICSNAGFCTAYSSNGAVGWNGGDQAWHQVVATWNTTGTVNKIYIDGALGSTVTTTSGTAGIGTSLMYTGGNLNGVNIVNPLHATLDEIAFYTSELNSTRILAHYNAGIATATCPRLDWPYSVQAPSERRYATRCDTRHSIQ